MKSVLVTGGLGYIGSHTTVKLIEKGYHVIIIDSLYNSREEVVDRIENITGIRPTFYHADISVNGACQPIFRNFDVEAVIHFAAHKSVSNSIYTPIQYYENNVGGLTSLLMDMNLFGVKNLIFSSSCTVYGEPKVYKAISELTPTQKPKTPYGMSKYLCEEILETSSNQLNSIALRYFNPIGNHESGLLYEDPRTHPENLMPYIQGVIEGKFYSLQVFGDDYDTPDGSCIRDYINVNDLADAHVKALEIVGNKPYDVINVGTGNGVSVFEIIEAFKKEGVDIPYQIAPRREGDIEKIYANIEKAKNLMGWEPQRDISDSVRSILKKIEITS
jgi:UDP-glucose 4-epimerase